MKDRKEYMKKYYEANKEKASSYYKKYRVENKETIEAYRESKKDGLYTVYLLPKENYVGMTNNLYMRLKKHKSDNNDTTDAEVLGKYESKRKALDVEKEYHNKGYKGINKNYMRKKTEVQILKEMLTYKNIIIASLWGLTTYASMYVWMWVIVMIFES